MSVDARQQAIARFVGEQGKAEVDGLPVPVLDAIVTDALDELLDADIRKEARQAGSEERRLLPDAILAVLEALEDGEVS